MSAVPSVVDDVIRLLSDRVRGEVLDRVVLELLDADTDPPDQELEALLVVGELSGSLQREFDGGCWLLACRSSSPGQLVSRVRLAAEAYRAPVRTARLGDTAWALLSERSRQWVDDVLSSPDFPDHLALIRQVPTLRLVPSLRASLDVLLDLGLRRGWRGLADADRLDTARRVEALLDLAAAQPELVEGPLGVLLDDPDDTALAETLLAWFAADREAAAAAERLHLHVNTLRYRLRRVQDLTGVDLSDWDQRLLAELQLRLWDANRAPRNGEA